MSGPKIVEPEKFNWGSGDLTWVEDPHVLPDDEQQDQKENRGEE